MLPPLLPQLMIINHEVQSSSEAKEEEEDEEEEETTVPPPSFAQAMESLSLLRHFMVSSHNSLSTTMTHTGKN